MQNSERREPGDLPKTGATHAAGGAVQEIRMATSTIAMRETRAAAWKVALPVFLAGVFLVYVVGMAQTAPIHNAAHDTRHSLSFPCH